MQRLPGLALPQEGSVSSVLRGPPRPGPSLLRPVHRPGSGVSLWGPSQAGLPTMTSPSGRGGLGRGGGCTVIPGLVLVVPSTPFFSDLLSPEQAPPWRGHRVCFLRASAKVTCSHSQPTCCGATSEALDTY